MTDRKSEGAGVLVCIPTYNERENIEKIVPAVLKELSASHVLIVDDNSPDGTGRVADSMSEEDDRIFVLHRHKKEGLGRAYLEAFSWALERDYTHVIEFDADFSHDPIYLPQMIDLLDSADMVVGSRRVKGGGTENWGLLRRLVSAAGSYYARAVLQTGISDLTGGFNGFKRETLERLNLNEIETSGYGFQIEIKYRAVKAQMNVVEMPIVFRDRVEGKSKMSLGIFVEALARVLQMRFK